MGLSLQNNLDLYNKMALDLGIVCFKGKNTII